MSTNKPEYQRKRRLELREWVYAIKSTPCFDCDLAYPPEIMQFDHTEEGTKTSTISRMVSGLYGKRMILNEIAKCDLVCPNCHAIRTFKRRMVSGSFEN